MIDIDSSLFPTYSCQEGKSFNSHYYDYGYHPLLAYDGMTGDLLSATLRPGSCYTSKDTTSFLEPLLDEFNHDYPEIPLYLRGDSGFADVMIYEKLESNGVSDIVNNTLHFFGKLYFHTAIPPFYYSAAPNSLFDNILIKGLSKTEPPFLLQQSSLIYPNVFGIN